MKVFLVFSTSNFFINKNSQGRKSVREKKYLLHTANSTLPLANSICKDKAGKIQKVRKVKKEAKLKVFQVTSSVENTCLSRNMLLTRHYMCVS